MPPDREPRPDVHADPRWGPIDEAITLAEFDRAEQLLDALAAELGPDEPAILYERAVIAWERDGPEAAAPLLDQLLSAAPEHADGHYLRALAHAEADEHELMVEHFSRTLELDARADLGPIDEAELDTIESIAAEVLTGIPEEFRVHLRNVPIVLEPRPHPELVREGFDPRSLGLFEGLEQGRLAAGVPATAPTRIVLFYANLLADFEAGEELAEEIEITILHEIGHFFGLDEDDVERLGLE